MPSQLELAAARFRRELLNNERAAASDMVRMYGEAWRRTSQRAADVQAQIRAARLTGQPISPAWFYQQDRAETLQAQIEAELSRFAAFAEESTAATQMQAIQAAGRHAAGLVDLAAGVRPAGVEVPFDVLPASALQELVGFASDGSPLRDVFGEIAGVAERVTDTLGASLAAGLGPRETARLLRRQFGVGLARALTISRTETLRAYREAMHRNYEANDDVVEGWVWHATLTPRTCAACVVGDTIVSGPAIQKVFSRHYTGNVIIIETAGGKHLTVTPNHPILTESGWVAAELLQEGDYVVSSPDSNGAALGIGIDNYQMPTVIKEIAETFSMVSTEMKCTTPDFHGDGVGSDAYIVRTRCLLGNDGNPFSSKHFKQSNFSLRGSIGQSAASFFFPSLGSVQPAFPRDSMRLGFSSKNWLSLFQWDFGAAQGSVFDRSAPLDASNTQAGGNCGTCDAKSLGEFHFGVASQISSGNFRIGQLHKAVAQIAVLLSGNRVALLFSAQQIPLAKNVGQPFAADAESGRDLLRTLTGQVRLDRILKIDVRGFSGHVYNLQTESGWFAANGIITHNCWAMHGTVHRLDERMDEHPNGRCTALPVLKPWRELGLDIPDRRPVVVSGEDEFAKLTPAEQERVLGKAAFAAWQDGAVTLKDFAAHRHSAEWGDTLQVASLEKMLGKDKAAGYLRFVRGWGERPAGVQLRLADMRTIADIERYAKVHGMAGEVDLSGFGSVDVAREVVGQLEKLMSEWNHAPITAIRARGMAGSIGRVTSYADSNRLDYEIHNRLFDVNSPTHQSLLRQMQNLFNVAARPGEEALSTVTHEFGHTVASQIHEVARLTMAESEALKKIHRRWLTDVNRIARRGAYKNSGQSDYEEFRRKHMSDYARSSMDEFIAEAFAQHYHGVVDNPYAEEVLAVLSGRKRNQ